MFYLSQQDAKDFDNWLMSPSGPAFTLPQLMELAGLTVAQIIHKYFPPSAQYKNVFIAIGPGNNGGDGLVAARHLAIFGYSVTIYKPKTDKEQPDFFHSLSRQCEIFNVKITSEIVELIHYDLLVDAIFGFGFRGDLKDPFKKCLDSMIKSKIPIVSIDCPSGWTAENCTNLQPEMLISLTAPKQCAKHFKGRHHVLGGRFIPNQLPEHFERLNCINYLYNSASDLFIDISQK